MGSDWIISGVFLRSDQELYFEPGVVVMAKQGAFQIGDRAFNFFEASGKQNIKIYGDDSASVTLQMRKSDYLDTSLYSVYSESRMILSFASCKNIEISGLTLKDSGGDGIYLGASGANGCADVTVRDIVVDNPLRNGLSVIGVKNLLVEDCLFKNSSDGLINDGIDFEPNTNDNRLVNCVVRNCKFENNDEAGIRCLFQNLDSSSSDVSISIENCDIVGETA